MKTDLKKLRADAAEAQAKANYRKAVGLYEEVCERDSSDALAHHRAGELHGRLGRIGPACERLGTAAELYAKQGFIVKAIAVCKMILQLDPSHEVTQAALVELYARKAEQAPAPSQPPMNAPPPMRPAVAGPSVAELESIPLADAGPNLYTAGVSSQPPMHLMGSVLDGDGLAARPPTGPVRPPLPSGVSPAWLSSVEPPRPAGPPPRAAILEDLEIALPGAKELSGMGIENGAPASRATPAAAPASSSAAGSRKRSASEIRGAMPRAPRMPSADEPKRPTAPIPSAPARSVVSAPSPSSAASAPPVPMPVASRATAPIVPGEGSFVRPVSSSPPPPPPSFAFAAARDFVERTDTSGVHALPIQIASSEPGSVDALDAIEISIDDEPATAPPPVPARGLPESALFEGLDPGTLRALIAELTFERFEAGEPIAREGETGESLYVIADGEVRVVRGEPPREVGRLRDGDFFGEIAIVSSFPRVATVIAERSTEVLRVSRDQIWRIIEEHPEFLARLIKFVRDRLISTLTKTSPLFLALPPTDRAALASQFKLLEVEEGRELVRAGQRSEGLFVLLGGRCRLEIAGRDPSSLPLLGPGAIVGEVSLMTRAPATATVRTLDRCWVLWMSPATFSEVLMTYPTVLEYVHELASARQHVASLRMP